MFNIYEVIAIENKLPLFFNEHVDRLYSSIHNYNKMSLTQLRVTIIKLIKKSLEADSKNNIKIIYSVDANNFSIQRLKSRRPDRELYLKGASVELYKAERDTPLIKKENEGFREAIDTYCSKYKLYDVLLINRNGYITEGSRSNFLLIDKKGNIITSPTGEALNGITRAKIYSICKAEGITIIEKNITEELLKMCQSLIITGTSPEILPIINCGDIDFDISNKLIKRLITSFNKLKLQDRAIAEELLNR